MNKADSERMAGILETMGYQEANAELDADLVLYNICTIRDNAEQKVYSYLGRQAIRKRTNPNLTLVVAGCVAQQEGESLTAPGARAGFGHGTPARQSPRDPADTSPNWTTGGRHGGPSHSRRHHHRQARQQHLRLGSM